MPHHLVLAVCISHRTALGQHYGCMPPVWPYSIQPRSHIGISTGSIGHSLSPIVTVCAWLRHRTATAVHTGQRLCDCTGNSPRGFIQSLDSVDCAAVKG